MNTKLLRQVKKAILEHPDQFEMRWWFTNDLELDYGNVNRIAGGCGTAACIGGWALHLKHKQDTLNATREYIDSAWIMYATDATDLLGLNADESTRLFNHAKWPLRFLSRYIKAKQPKARARAAADRINHFIKTKGAE